MIELKLEQLVWNAPLADSAPCYADPFFSRHTGQLDGPSACRVEWVEDRLIEQDVSFCQMCLCFQEAAILKWSAAEGEEHAASGWQLPMDGGPETCWFPGPPVKRRLNERHLVESQETVHVTWTRSADGRTGRLEAKAGDRIELSFFRLAGAGNRLREEFGSLSTVERRPVVSYLYFHYESPADIWNYFSQGRIYHQTPYPYNGTVLCPCEQCANTLYEYMDYLYRQTDKALYGVIRDLVAYAVMLSLPAGGQWRHGLWTDRMETHLRFQLDGIDLLMSYFRETRRPIFWDKARQAMDFVLSCADSLEDGGIWFVHDTLELKESLRKLRYNPFIESRALGKSLSNTLCLNTHLWTLVLLKRMTDLEPNDVYEAAFNRGLQALQTVAEARPATPLYAFFFGLRDLLRRVELRWDYPKVRGWCRHYDRLMRTGVLPRLKKRFPRLVMPNGYLERDLSASRMNDFYHLLTLKDMLLLYSHCREPWLKALIRRSVQYTNVAQHARWFALRRDHRANLLTDILLLSAACVNRDDLDRLADFLQFCRRRSLPLSMDSLVHPDMAVREPKVRIDSTEVHLFQPACRERFEWVLVNGTDREQEVRLEWTCPGERDTIELFTRDRRVLKPDSPLRIPAGGWVAAVRSKG